MRTSLHHFVVAYELSHDVAYMAEVDASEIYQFGPFDKESCTSLSEVLFPTLPLLWLAKQSRKLDDASVVILGNALLSKDLESTEAGAERVMPAINY